MKKIQKRKKTPIPSKNFALLHIDDPSCFTWKKAVECAYYYDDVELFLLVSKHPDIHLHPKEYIAILKEINDDRELESALKKEEVQKYVIKNSSPEELISITKLNIGQNFLDRIQSMNSVRELM